MGNIIQVLKGIQSYLMDFTCSLLSKVTRGGFLIKPMICPVMKRVCMEREKMFHIQKCSMFHWFVQFYRWYLKKAQKATGIRQMNMGR